jgi:hypothetical protein
LRWRVAFGLRGGISAIPEPSSGIRHHAVKSGLVANMASAVEHPRDKLDDLTIMLPAARKYAD